MGGGKPANTVITLTVDTDKLVSDPENVNKYVVFTDNQSDPAENPGHPETYVSTVNKGATCEWQGVAKNGRDVINIDTITKKSTNGKDLLNTPIPPGLQGPKGGGKKITARVRANYLDGDEPYTVAFNIGENPFVYFVDPRIKMNT
ncbi:hypothetical protein [Winogradskyella alexanderae]|uniref:Uncharacterized protein n=1 Tax=Winogradskyella alexanderae TaxID=2877123 RepID=A0ABS7XV19_9FLAO|nr:hypothetical protein [Winogradskyella alexanderae]MCA0132757.1 hypothetical protein [Winogradskyella alexanderae]